LPHWLRRLSGSGLALALVLVLAVPGAAAASGSAPEAQTQAAAVTKEIAVLQQLGIVDGVADGMSSPDSPMTKAEAAIVLGRVLQLEGSGADAAAFFLDVAADDAAAPAIAALQQVGIVNGYQGLYHPQAPLTHEQMATLLARALGWHDNDIQAQYADLAQINKVHQADALKLKQQFIFAGNEFVPRKAVTHAHFARSLYRALQLDLRTPGYLPLEYFIQQPAQMGFQVSPDGKRLAYMQPWNNRMNIFVKTIGEEDEAQVTRAVDRSIQGFIWASDDKIIFASDTDGDENFHIYSINVDGTGTTDLTPYENTTAGLIDPLEEDPDRVLIAMNKRDPRFFDVYRIDIHTGEAELAAENPGNISGWLTDHAGKIRIAAASDGNISTLLYRETEEEEFEPLLTTELGDSFVPVSFTKDDKQLYVVSNIDRDKTALLQYDPAAKTTVKTIYENEESDIAGFIPSQKDGSVLAVIYETDKVRYHFLDSDFEKLYNTLKDQVPGKEVSILREDDKGKVMFFAYSDRSMGAYYNYDPAADKLELLANTSPWLDESKLAEMKPVTFTARDGLTIHGYLTLPNGADPADLPLVVNPHGGPWARDSWGYNPEVQLLANRGYAVLQVNFRGSTGYGKAFLNAGNKEWGRAMQDDLTDGVNWLVEQGIVDAERVAIYGASYGGYATLAGLAFTPEVYAAGVDYVGPSNLFTLLQSVPPYWASQVAMFHERMGDPVADEELLTAVSPLFHADQIKAPLFVVQGANDPRVNQAESDQIVQALRDHNIDVPYMLKANEGHGFMNIENQLDFYRALEIFLHRHLME